MSTPKNPLRASTVVLVLVGALLVSTAVGAQAAALTPKVVRKIAAKVAVKVVTKKAATLSVAHAATADTVGGATADQLRTTELRYAIAPIAPDFSLAYTFPGLPSGNYLVTYWFRATTTAAAARVSCDVTPSPSDPSVAESFSVSDGAGTARGSASGSFTTTTGPAALTCAASTGNLTMFGQVSFVRVDTVVPATAAGS